MMNLQELFSKLALSTIFVALGFVVFLIAFWIMVKLSPFSIRKEIEEDQNSSLGILMGCVIIGLSIIVAAAIHG